MAEKKYFWLKMPRNFFEKHYIKILRAKDNGDLLVMFYIWMITESIDHEGKLRFSEDIPYDAEMLAEASGFALQIVTQALQQFSKLQLVVTESDGTLFLPKSLKMIGSESASAQRVREYREREKNKTKPTETPENTECNERVTESNVDVQKCNIEKELEKELEKENKKGGKRETTQSIFERLLPEYAISDVMADKLREWFKYKTERKDGYKEQGMKSLLKQVANKVSVYGDTAVCNLIDECMSNGWKGIIWDAEHYMRYMDDFVIISEDLEQLKRWEKQIEIFLADVLKLQLNPKTTIVYAKNGVDFVGYRHWNSTKKIRKDAMRRLKRLMKNFKDGTITEEFFDKSFTSRIGSIKHADTYNLVQKITCEAKELKESHA